MGLVLSAAFLARGLRVVVFGDSYCFLLLSSIDLQLFWLEKIEDFEDRKAVLKKTQPLTKISVCDRLHLSMFIGTKIPKGEN